MYFRARLDGDDPETGRGRIVADRVYLRLEKTGQARTLCGSDSDEWFTVGEEGLDLGLGEVGG